MSTPTTDTAREVRSYADIIEQNEGMTLAEYPELPAMLRDLAAEIERLNGLASYAEGEISEALRLLDEGNIPTARAALCEAGRSLEAGGAS